VNIFEGTSEAELSKGVGHFIQSVMPGVSDNSVLSGHRDTVFSKLGRVRLGAKIKITVESGTYIYTVNRIRIVSSDDRTVIVPTERATLTLSTCYPFTFIGNAPKRYIVIAVLDETVPI
jgi:sortase A